MKYFLGIPFWNRGVVELLRTVDSEGGLLTVPSAPSLAQMRKDASLATAYRGSDFAVVDGGYVALVLRFVLRERLPRISGLQILQRLIGTPESRAIPFQERRLLFVVPSGSEAEKITDHLMKQGFRSEMLFFYEAPFYKNDKDFEDTTLSDRILQIAPDWTVLCIGGGRQEKLGYFLRNAGFVGSRRTKRHAILCTGGAISFFTGSQAKIPTWADRMYLGWLFRICESPGTFLPRYWNAAFELPLLIWEERMRLFAGARAIAVGSEPENP